MRKASWLLVPATIAAVVAAVSLYSQGRSGPVAASDAGRGVLSYLSWGRRQSRHALGRQHHRFARRDRFDPRVAVRAEAIRPTRFRVGNAHPRGAAPAATRGPMMPNGVVVTTSGDDSAQPSTSKPRKATFLSGPRIFRGDMGKEYLQGRVAIDRVPTMARLTDSTEEQDFPAMAQADDSVYVTYTEFVHSDRSKEARPAVDRGAAPTSTTARVPPAATRSF